MIPTESNFGVAHSLRFQMWTSWRVAACGVLLGVRTSSYLSSGVCPDVVVLCFCLYLFNSLDHIIIVGLCTDIINFFPAHLYFP